MQTAKLGQTIDELIEELSVPDRTPVPFTAPVRRAKTAVPLHRRINLAVVALGALGITALVGTGATVYYASQQAGQGTVVVAGTPTPLPPIPKASPTFIPSGPQLIPKASPTFIPSGPQLFQGQIPEGMVAVYMDRGNNTLGKVVVIYSENGLARNRLIDVPKSVDHSIVQSLDLSPDREAIAYTQLRDNVHQLWTITLSTLTGEKIGEIMNGRSPVWSPDGQQIAYVSTNPPTGVYIAGRDGRTIRTLIDPSEIRHNAAFAPAVTLYDWKRDKLVISGLTDSFEDAAVVDVKNKQFRRIEHVRDFSSSWFDTGFLQLSPEADKLYVADIADRNRHFWEIGNRNVWEIDIATGNKINVLEKHNFGFGDAVIKQTYSKNRLSTDGRFLSSLVMSPKEYYTVWLYVQDLITGNLWHVLRLGPPTALFDIK